MESQGFSHLHWGIYTHPSKDIQISHAHEGQKMLLPSYYDLPWRDTSSLLMNEAVSHNDDK